MRVIGYPDQSVPILDPNADDLYRTGLQFLQTNQTSLAFDYLERSAKLGNTDASFTIGNIYELG